MTLSDLKDWMEIILNGATALAIIAGGIWSLFTFNALRLRRKALAELQEIESKLRQQAVLDIHIDANQLKLPGDYYLYIGVEVSIKNIGNRNTHLLSETSPLILEKVYWEENEQRMGECYKDFEGLDYVLRVGNEHKLPYVVRVNTPGLYKITFTIELSPEERDIAVEAGQRSSPYDQGISWVGEKFFVVDLID